MRQISSRRMGLIGAAASGILLAPVVLAKLIATKEFEDGSTRPVTIVVLPSQVELVKQRIIRQEAQIEESGDLEAHLTAAVVAELNARGYEARSLDADQISSDPGLHELYVDAGRRFREMLANVEVRLSKSKNVENRRYNAGDEVKLLAARLRVHAVALARMQIVAPAAGVRALNLGLGGEQAMLSVTIVDGKSGDIEAYITLPALRRGSMIGGHDEIVEHPAKEMGKYASATLDGLPEAVPALRTEQNGEDVLSDLESLLDE